MSFNNKYFQYGAVEIPTIDLPSNITTSSSNIAIKYNNVNYTGHNMYILASYDYQITSNINLNQMPTNTPICALKSKKNNTYMFWVKSTNNVLELYFNSTLSLSGAVNAGSSTLHKYDTQCALFLTSQGIMFGYTYTQYRETWGLGLNYDIINKIMGEIDGGVISNEFGNASESGGYGGNFDDSSDVIGIPPTPSIGVSNVGFINVYKTNANALQNLGSELFPDFIPPTPADPTDSVGDALVQGFNNVVDNLSNLLTSYVNSNLINYIIDCHCIPVAPTTGTESAIKIGFKEFSQSASKVTSDYVDFDCGTLNIKEYYGNFIDYIGTRAQLYLPFIGFVPIKNEYFQNGLLQVKYRFNIVDGSFMCYLLSSSSKSELTSSVVATYSGNACIHLPITGINYANMISGVVNGAGSIVSGKSGNVGDKVNSALNTIALKPEMQSSNSYNSTSAYLGIRYPYLVIEREVSNFSEYYPNEYGLPLNVTKRLGDLKGFVVMDNIHLNGITCTEEEKDMIIDLLTNGVIV